MTALKQEIPAAFVETTQLGRVPVDKLQKLSVLMPIYNEQRTLRRIVKRVLDAPLGFELELVAVDDCSQDGSWKILQELAKEDSRIIPVRHKKNQGKGASIRTAIKHMQGDVAIVQDADLEYDPNEFPKLLKPILDGKADAVFGSRFTGSSRRVLFFWHSMANRGLTFISNMFNNLNLTDMETCYKAVRADTLKNLRLSARTFTFEPELTTRLAQWGARIYEVPITYSGRTFDEGKKIRARDGLKAIGQLIKTRFFDTKFTDHAGFYILTAVAKANKYNRLVLDKVKRFLGDRLLEAGSGIGNISTMFLERDLLLMVDYEPLYISRLHDRFGHLSNAIVEQGDLTKKEDFDHWKENDLDTVFCSNVVEHLKDDQAVLQNFHDVLQPGGHCIIVVPAEPGLYTGVDADLGHYRRYKKHEMRERMEAAGFEVVYEEQFNKLGAIGWFVSGKIFRRRRLSPRQMIWFDRLLWLAKIFEFLPFIPGMSLITVGKKPGTTLKADATSSDN